MKAKEKELQAREAELRKKEQVIAFKVIFIFGL